jgi:hypothetical protein
MSNQSNDFNTPPEIIDPIKEFWGGVIHLDPCSNKYSKVDSLMYLELPVNSLEREWAIASGERTKIFVNPPYAPYWISDSGVVKTSKQYKAMCERNDPALKTEDWTYYSLKDWLKKGVEERGLGGDLIYLIPSRGTGSVAWQKIVLPNFDAICFLKKRIPFWENGSPCRGPNGKINPSTFDCALVYFGFESRRFQRFFNKLGCTIIQKLD